jgi:lysozyme
MDMTLLSQLKRHEGFRSKAYLCPAGFLTVGYGRNLDTRGITPREAEYLLINDINDAVTDLSKFDWFVKLSEVRQAVLINMYINLGLNGLLKFKRMIAALEDGRYQLAANEMMESKWAEQVGQRAVELKNQMVSNAFMGKKS